MSIMTSLQCGCMKACGKQNMVDTESSTDAKWYSGFFLLVSWLGVQKFVINPTEPSLDICGKSHDDPLRHV